MFPGTIPQQNDFESALFRLFFENGSEFLPSIKWTATDMPFHLAPAGAAFAASLGSGSGVTGAVHPDFSSKLIAK